MPLNVVTATGETLPIHSPGEFEQIFQVEYCPSLKFCDTRIRERMAKKCKRALSKGWITARQKWLGHYYADALGKEPPLDLTIAWIDEKVGYGVWTNREIPAHAYIGEYAGLLRRRRLWKRWSNLYCFDYTVGEKKSTFHVIDAERHGNHTRFINHSFAPNVEPVSVHFEGQIFVVFYAKAKIPAGTQLLYDYGEEYWMKRSGPVAFASSPAKITSR